VAVLALLMVGGVTPVSSATQPVTGATVSAASSTGTILYTRRFLVFEDAYSYQLWTMAGDGTGARPVTTDPSLFPFAADLSSDGRHVAFTVGRGSDVSAGGLYVVDVDGSGRHDVLAGNTLLNEVRDPTWSPDGTRLAFVGVDKNFKHEIWTVRADGTALTKVTSCDCAYTNTPRWSPTRNELLWSPDEFDVSRLDLTTGQSTTIYDNAPSGAMSVLNYSWAPDGERVYFSGQALQDVEPGLFEVSRAGTGLREIARQQDVVLNDPFASPDDTRLAASAQVLSSDSSSDDSDVWTMDTVGTNSNTTDIPGELWEEVLDWGTACSSGCQPGGRWSNITLHLSADDSISGGLMPGVAGAPVVVQLLKKVTAHWKVAYRTTVTTSPYSTYAAPPHRIRGSLCKYKVRWAGNTEHDPATAKTHSFGC